jgi:branched-chain amino acid transport system substrate-binding protein
MNIKRQPLYALLATILFVGAACRQQHPGAVAVGALVPLSGPNMSYGTACRQAYEIARDDAKRLGRAELNVIYGDSLMEVGPTLRQYQDLKRKVVAFVEVAGSGPALAVSVEAAKDRIPILSAIASSPKLTAGGGDYFFRVIPSDEHSAPALSDWAFEAGLKRAVMVFNQQNAWATGFKEAAVTAYRQRGGLLPDDAVIGVTRDTLDFSAAIAALKRKNPDVWFVGLQGAQAGLFVSQALDKGVTQPFLGVDNFDEQEFVDAAGRAKTQVRFVLPAVARSEAAQRFAAEFRARFNREPGGLAFRAYDAYMVLVSAIEAVQKAGLPLDGAHLQAALRQIRTEGLTGSIEFDSNNDLKRAAYTLWTYTPDGKMIPAPQR